MDNIQPLFEWSSGHEIGDNERLFMEEYTENMEDDTEINRY